MIRFTIFTGNGQWEHDILKFLRGAGETTDDSSSVKYRVEISILAEHILI